MIIEFDYPGKGSIQELAWYDLPGNSNYSSATPVPNADRDAIKLAIAKCLAGNLCKGLSNRKIGKNSSRERCAVYELLNFYRVANDICTTSDELHSLKCAIESYCHCGDDCGCTNSLTLNPPTPEKVNKSE